jgi:hypothetical protein
MMKHITRTLTLTLCVALIATAFIACGRNKNEPTPSEEEGLQAAVNEIIERRAGIESSLEETPVTPEDGAGKEVVTDWPEDIPLIEPYEVQDYLAGSEFRQIGVYSPHTLDEVFDFYNKELFDVHGWELLGNKGGKPGVFFTYKVGKSNRVVQLMVRADSDGKRCLVQIKILE